MAASTSATPTAAGLARKIYSLYYRQPFNSSIKFNGTHGFSTIYPILYTKARVEKSFLIRASNPQPEELEPTIDNGDTDASNFKDDLEYLLKVGVGSVLGAAVIKYGSVLLPEITRPNLQQALLIIFSPVILAVLLLIKQTYAKP